MNKRLLSPVASVAAAFLFMMSFMFGAQALSAQGDATPAAMADEGHPAHIHAGTCETLGDVVFPLNNLTPFGMDAAPATPTGLPASPEAGMGSTPEVGEIDAMGTPVTGAGVAVAQSSTDVDASLDDIMAAEHAVNVHESVENIQNYIACGDITGSVTNGELHIQLQELNGSGFVGEAHLTDNGDGTTTVLVTLSETGTGMTGTPEASPAT
jgi:hypothetical protein